jgi:DNA-binding transcriptional LysR family regulator
VPVCSPEVARRLRKPEDLAGERLLHLIGIDDSWNYWADQAGLKDLAGLESHSFSSVVLTISLLRNGTGVSVSHEILVRLNSWAHTHGRNVRTLVLWSVRRVRLGRAVSALRPISSF